MILHRFMSQREYDALMAGETLRNTTDHAALGEKTTSQGFCFFPEDPDEAIHWLSFIVDADQCVTLDVPDAMVSETRGRYRDVERDNGPLLGGDVPMLWRREYCLQEYSLCHVQVLCATDRYHLYGRFPEGATFWQKIERCRLIGQMENERLARQAQAKRRGRK